MSEGFENIKYDNRGLVPAIVQEAGTGRVLMLAYMNAESLRMSLETGYTHFWSRSRQKFWKKGESSGHVQAIRSIHYDCDGDTLLVTVDQTGPACHTGERGCFYRALGPGAAAEASPFPPLAVLGDLERVIAGRKSSPKEGSYTNRLLADPTLARAKVAEESRETVEASEQGDAPHLVYEAADLLFHLLALLAVHQVGLDQVCLELTRRFGNPPKKGDALS